MGFFFFSCNFCCCCCLFFLLFLCCCSCSLIYEVFLIYFCLTLLSFFLFFLCFIVFVRLFCLLYSSAGILIWSCFLVCVLVSFVFNWPALFLVLFAHQVTFLCFVFFELFWLSVCVYVCVFFCFFFFFWSDFTFTACLGFVFCVSLYFLFLCVSFNPF